MSFVGFLVPSRLRMKNEKPDGDDRPWNTNDVVLDGMSCKTLARISTCFISALRMGNSEINKNGVKGLMKFLSTILAQQVELVDSPNLSDREKQIVEANGVIAIQAACLAGIFAVNQIDPRYLALIGVSTIETIKELSKNVGPIGPDDEVIVQIRKGNEDDGEDTIQMSIRLEPSQDMNNKIGEGNIGKQIKKIVEKKPKPDSPDQGPVIFGDN